MMDWPAKSPDLSPIENLWAVLGDKIKNMANPPTIRAGLTMALQHEWHAITQATITKLLNNMERRCTKTVCVSTLELVTLALLFVIEH